MTPVQIERALEMSRKCQQSNYKQCGEPEKTQTATAAPTPATPKPASTNRSASDAARNKEQQSAAAVPKPPLPTAPVPKIVSTGTGFFVSSEGHIVTNAHVVKDCAAVRSSSGGILQRLAIDDVSDLAILKGSGKPNGFAQLRGGRGVRPGDNIVVVGFPFSGQLTSDATVTTGNVSALSGPGNDRRLIQMTAPVQPGNSGGPLLGGNGTIVGVVVAKLNAIKIAKITGDIPQNVNFAVSLGTLQSLLDANAVPYETKNDDTQMNTADIAAGAIQYTLLLECWQ